MDDEAASATAMMVVPEQMDRRAMGFDRMLPDAPSEHYPRLEVEFLEVRGPAAPGRSVTLTMLQPPLIEIVLVAGQFGSVSSQTASPGRLTLPAGKVHDGRERGVAIIARVVSSPV